MPSSFQINGTQVILCHLTTQVSQNKANNPENLISSSSQRWCSYTISDKWILLDFMFIRNHSLFVVVVYRRTHCSCLQRPLPLANPNSFNRNANTRWPLSHHDLQQGYRHLAQGLLATATISLLMIGNYWFRVLGNTQSQFWGGVYRNTIHCPWDVDGGISITLDI